MYVQTQYYSQVVQNGHFQQWIEILKRNNTNISEGLIQWIFWRLCDFASCSNTNYGLVRDKCLVEINNLNGNNNVLLEQLKKVLMEQVARKQN
jgi:hypothetical protein